MSRRANGADHGYGRTDQSGETDGDFLTKCEAGHVFFLPVSELCDQGSAILNRRTNAGGNQDSSGEKSGNGGGDVVLDICVQHFSFLFQNLAFETGC